MLVMNLQVIGQICMNNLRLPTYKVAMFDNDYLNQHQCITKGMNYLFI